MTESEEDKHFRERREAEFLLISPTNCGRTWLRLLLGRYFQLMYKVKGDVDLHNLYHLSEVNPNIPSIKPIHERYGQFGTYKNKKVILLVRDPRDAIISKYMRSKRKAKYLESHDDYSIDLREYVRTTEDFQGYFVQLIKDWQDNSNSAKDFLLVRYEDLRSDTLSEVVRILDFISVPLEGNFLEQAIEFSSFDNMKKMELEGSSLVKSGPMKGAKGKSPDLHKVRKGKIGGYREYLNEDEIAFVDRVVDLELSQIYGRGSY
ncbi:MAG: sulfotransferase domain-containing protein [Cyanobacteria bacterium P01_F01_bin.150]